MAKDPAFLFYPGDWLGGTMGMTLEQKGAYMELLVLQWNCHRITDAVAKQVVGDRLWHELAHKFSADGRGLFNARLETELIKRKKHSENQSNNAKKRWERPQSGGNAVAMPLENENRNENENINKDGNKGKGTGKGKPKSPQSLFRDSKYFDLAAFETAFLGTEYETTFDVNLKYYYEQILNWSDSKGEKKIDWLATAKIWINRDIANHKLITKSAKNGKQNSTLRQGVQAEFNNRFGAGK